VAGVIEVNSKKTILKRGPVCGLRDLGNACGFIENTQGAITYAANHNLSGKLRSSGDTDCYGAGEPIGD
jgi:hypothetical protein